MQYQLKLGDCLDVLRTLPDNSVDAIVTDPPYGLSFMGRKWDYDVPSIEVWAECLRVLKPGGHMLAFAGTRTQHRMAVRIEDAGFEIRDMIAWLYGSGFPKSRNIANDMHADDAAAWTGWGTALKPALEPITLARKPLSGTVAGNVLEHGTGALNIDGCRVPAESMRPNSGSGGLPRRHEDEQRGPGIVSQPHEAGRWPANVKHDGGDEVVALFPHRTSGAMKSGTRRSAQDRPGSVCYGTFGGNITRSDIAASSGSAARFFYVPKASRSDRNEGCEGMERKPLHWSSGAQNPGSFQSEGTDKTSQNNHPTVKPTDLMAYLCLLVTPPGGTVLDPFMGSGSTGKAAIREGFRFIGIEREVEYLAIAKARIEHETRELPKEPAQRGLFSV